MNFDEQGRLMLFFYWIMVFACLVFILALIWALIDYVLDKRIDALNDRVDKPDWDDDDPPPPTYEKVTG